MAGKLAGELEHWMVVTMVSKKGFQWAAPMAAPMAASMEAYLVALLAVL